MKNWLRNKLHNFLYPRDPQEISSAKLATVSVRSESIDMDNSLRFNVLVGSGGIVLQLIRYDHKKDRSDNSTHIIPEHEDIAVRIGQIVSMEILKH